MKRRFIPALVMLIAGLICCIMSIMYQWDIMYSLVTLLLVLLIFYSIGAIAARIIGHVQAQHQAEEEAKRKEEEERKRQEELAAAMEKQEGEELEEEPNF